MSLDRILLTLLESPASGYDLKREFEAGAHTFWPALPSQIYSTLNRMETQGLLTSTRAPSDSGPDRRVYGTTEAGRTVLDAWLRGGPDVGRERFAYLGQLAAMSLLDEPAMGRPFLTQLKRWFGERLDYLRELEPLLLEDGTPESIGEDAFFSWAALRMGISVLETRVACCDELLEILDRRLAVAESGALAGEAR